jgi:hypothetical protein
MHAPIDITGATHDPKFRTVSWFGADYSFSPQQAKCIEVLWRFWLQGTPVIREEMILEVAGLTGARAPRSLKEVFSAGPGATAWGTMIGTGDRRGTVRLLDPHSQAIEKSP